MRPDPFIPPSGTKNTIDNTYNCLLCEMLPCILIHTGLFEMIVGVLTTCHTQYT
jgi:hypothetical protein